MPNPPNSKRVMRPSRFGNPYIVVPDPDTTHPFGREVATNEEAVDEFIALRKGDKDFREMVRKELRGYDLICSCGLNEVCHADVLLEWANEDKDPSNTYNIEKL